VTTAPFFPLYLKDWVMDTRSYSFEAKGVFIELLVLAWDRGSLPAESEALRALVICSPGVWRRVWPVLQPGWDARDGQLFHAKLEASRENVEKRSASAKAKAEKRWSVDATPDAAALPQQCQGIPAGNATTDYRLQTTDNRRTEFAIAHSVAPSPEDVGPVALRFPTVGGTASWPLTEAQVATWVGLFPHLDVRAQCQAALAWLLANPSRRKTARGMASFLVSWLGRSVDHARVPQPATGPFRGSLASVPDNPKAADLMAARAAKLAANALEDAAERAAAEALAVQE
jgi:uncharacterized protein YdaU (DUF1376 family)